MLIADLINLNAGRGDRPLRNIDTLGPEVGFVKTGQTSDGVTLFSLCDVFYTNKYLYIFVIEKKRSERIF